MEFNTSHINRIINKSTLFIHPQLTDNWYNPSDEMHITVIIKSMSDFMSYNHANSSKV